MPTLSGLVTLPDGAAAAAVQVAAAAVGAEISPGIAPLVALAQTTTGPDGAFAFSIVPTPATAGLVNAAGALNVRILALLDQEQRYSALHGVSLDLVHGGDAFAPVESFSLSLEAVPASTTEPPCPPPSLPPYPSPFGGMRIEVGDPEYKGGKVAELHAWDDMTSTFLYKEGGQHQIDIGVSVSGTDWKFGGTQSVTKDASSSQGPHEVAGRYGYSQRPIIRSQRFKYCASFGQLYSPLHYTVERQYASGGFDPGEDVSFKDGPGAFLESNRPGKMGDFGPSDMFTKEAGTTERWENALEAFGFQAGVISVYSENLKFSWKMGTEFGSPTDLQYHLWGSGPDPKSSPTLYAYSGPDPLGPPNPGDC